jgi:hypothetical protein
LDALPGLDLFEDNSNQTSNSETDLDVETIGLSPTAIDDGDMMTMMALVIH